MDVVAHTILSLLKKSADHLKSKGSTSPRLDAELLLAEVLGVSRVDLYVNFEQPLSEAEVDRYRELVRRRAKGEPVAYILGQAYFRNLTLEVGRDVLIPRPETEHLVDIALKVLKSREWRQPPAVLDLGTGSGAIAIALAVEYPDAVVTATETSSEAQRLAEENARTAGVAARVVFVQSDMFESLDPVETYDLIVSNPPYVADGEWDMLPTDVREFEPRSALSGGPDGLDFYRRIAAEAPAHLKPRGGLVLEIGHSQGPAVAGLIEATDRFAEIGVEPDYAGRDRVVVARRQ